MVASAVEAVSEADVIAAEVQAWEALHRLGALLGEPVEIVRAPSSPRVEVRGLASTQERKQAIVDAVSAIPLVTVDVRTVAEALAAKPKLHAALPSSPSHATSSTPDEPTPDGSTPNQPAPNETTLVQTGTGTVPIQPLIEAYVSAQRSAAGGAYAADPSSRPPGASTSVGTSARHKRDHEHGRHPGDRHRDRVAEP